MSEPSSQHSPESCNICGSSMMYVSSAKLLDRHIVRYFSCPSCQFLRTEKPYWLPEAYSEAIAATDTGIVQRNLKIARQLTCLLPALSGDTGRFLDVAGGTGLLTRLMRDNGFDFYWEDLYCYNILARGFEGSPGAAHYQAVTAFEALEHMEEPYDFIRNCVARSTTGTFIFSTELFDPPLPSDNWWYFSRVTGQHISFFTAQTLQRIAQQLQLRFMSHRGLHVLTTLDMPQKKFRKLLDKEDRGLFEITMRRRAGLTQPDHEVMTRKALGLDPRTLQNGNESAPTTGRKFQQRLKNTLYRLAGLSNGKQDS